MNLFAALPVDLGRVAERRRRGSQQVPLPCLDGRRRSSLLGAVATQFFQSVH
jgi:hypothetical protein